MTLIENLKADYARFPVDQSFHLYAQDVYFKDPMTSFKGIQKYQEMIGFIQKYFLDVEMELDEITQNESHIHTRWTLRWTAPFPWKPALAISGTSDLQINEDGLVCSHIDRWDCSRWEVLKQVFRPS